MKRPLKSLVILGVLAVSNPGFAQSEDTARERASAKISLVAQPLGHALKELARQADIQFVYFGTIEEDAMTAPVNAAADVSTALLALLAGTSLDYQFVDDKTVLISQDRPNSVDEVVLAGIGDAGGGTAAVSVNSRDRQSASSGSAALEGTSETGSGQSRKVLEETVVTARKREESINDIPFGITAFSAQDLQRADLQDFTDLDDFTPGLSFENLSSNRTDRGQPNIVIRGLNLQANAGSSEAALMFVDGAPIFGSEVGAFLDIERVEVLRGPQAAYFGRNTFSGAVNLVTKDPGDEFGVQLSGELGRFDTANVQGSLEGPIIPGMLNFRVSGQQFDRGGNYKNNVNGKREVGEESTTSLVGTLLFKPTDFLRLKLRATDVEIEDGPNPAFRFPQTFANCDPDNNGTVTWRCGEAPNIDIAKERVGFDNRFPDSFGEPELFPTRAGFREEIIVPFSLFSRESPNYIDGSIFIDEPGLAKQVRSYSGAAVIDLPNEMTFNWISVWSRTRSATVSDETTKPGLGDFLFPNLLDTFLVESYFENTSHEARLSSGNEQRLRWTFGGNLVEGESSPSNIGRFIIAPGGTTQPAIDTETLGVFGALYYDVTDLLTASIELRYQSDRVSIPSEELNKTFNDWGPRLTLEYALRPDVNLFVNWARGFRPGTFNGALRTFTPDQQQDIIEQTGATLDVDPEYLSQFEGGIKGLFLEGRLSASLVGYYGEITDQQVTAGAQIFEEDGTPRGIQVISNIGELELYGLELEGAFQATDRLRFAGTFAWNHTEYTKGLCILCVTVGSMVRPEDVVGSRLPGAPDITGSLIADYIVPLMDTSFDGFARAEYIYEGEKYATPANLFRTGDRHRVNVRAGVDNDSFRIEGYVTNLFDNETYDVVGRQIDLDSFGNGFFVGLPDRRAYGLRVTFDY